MLPIGTTKNIYQDAACANNTEQSLRIARIDHIADSIFLSCKLQFQSMEEAADDTRARGD